MPIVLAPDTVVEIEPPDIPVLQVGTPATVNVTVESPVMPAIGVVPPQDSDVMVVPVVGPPGPRGPAGASTNASCVWPVPVPVYLVQVIHELGFYPAGVQCNDTSDNPVEYAQLAYISTDIAEISFDVPFTGTIYLS